MDTFSNVQGSLHSVHKEKFFNSEQTFSSTNHFSSKFSFAKLFFVQSHQLYKRGQNAIIFTPPPFTTRTYLYTSFFMWINNFWISVGYVNIYLFAFLLFLLWGKNVWTIWHKMCAIESFAAITGRIGLFHRYLC